MSIVEYQTQGVRRIEDPHAAALRRAEYLKPADRALLEMVVSQRFTRRDIGQFLGIPSGTVTRRAWRIGNRLHDPLSIALIERPGKLPDEHRQIGIEHFVQGMRAREIADVHRMGIIEVKGILEFLRLWGRGGI